MDMTSIDSLFGIAVERELEAFEFYKAAAGRMKDASVKSIFQELSAQEYGHMELLEKYRHDPSLEMKIDAPSSDFKISEATELPRLSIAAKPADAIALAMKKEQQAVEFYRAMASSAGDPGLKSVMENLANMELGHKHRLEKIFVDIGYPEAF